MRFLHNGFREAWRFTGNPLRILMRRKSGASRRTSMHPAVALALAYLSGSIPFAAHRGQGCSGVDLRKHGSGNLGATNVFRVLGWKIGLAVFLLDALRARCRAAASALRDRRRARPDRLGDRVRRRGDRRPRAADLPQVRQGREGRRDRAGVFLALAPLPMLVTFGVFVAVVLRQRATSRSAVAHRGRRAARRCSLLTRRRALAALRRERRRRARSSSGRIARTSAACAAARSIASASGGSA